jgi:Protein of unknown function (DUF1559)
MPFTFTCPFCHLKSLVDESLAGKSGPCAGCGKQVTLPAGKGSLAPPEPSKVKRSVAKLRPSQALLIRLAISIVILAIVGLSFGGFLLPSIRQAAAFRNRNVCLQNMQQIVGALNSYSAKYGTYPPPVVFDSAGTPLYSWRVLILPELGYQAVYDAIDKSAAWNTVTNSQAIQLMPAVFASPGSVDAFALKESNYVLVIGPGTIFPANGPLPKSAIRDKPDQTILLVETTNGSSWMEPGDSIDTKRGIQIGNRAGIDIGGNHADAANAVTVSGAGLTLPNSISPSMLDALISANGQEQIDTSAIEVK